MTEEFTTYRIEAHKPGRSEETAQSKLTEIVVFGGLVVQYGENTDFRRHPIAFDTLFDRAGVHWDLSFGPVCEVHPKEGYCIAISCERIYPYSPDDKGSSKFERYADWGLAHNARYNWRSYNDSTIGDFVKSLRKKDFTVKTEDYYTWGGPIIDGIQRAKASCWGVKTLPQRVSRFIRMVDDHRMMRDSRLFSIVGRVYDTDYNDDYWQL